MPLDQGPPAPPGLSTLRVLMSHKVVASCFSMGGSADYTAWFDAVSVSSLGGLPAG